MNDLVGLPTVCLQMATLEGTEGALRRLQSKYMQMRASEMTSVMMVCVWVCVCVHGVHVRVCA